MTRQLTATEVKAKLLALLDDVAGGEELEITQHGRTVARLVPATGTSARKGAYRLKGAYTGVAISDDEDETLFATGATWDTT